MTSVFNKEILKGKVAIITGGGSGIGFEIAHQLGLHGCSLVIMGRRQNVLEEATQMFTASKIKSFYYCGDVRNEQHADEIFQQAKDTYGRVDILINAAAGNFLVSADELTLNGFRTVIDIDTIGTFNMCRASFKHLKASKGKIVNVSANLHKPATWYQLPASAAKAAVDSLTRSLALEWGQYGITVNAPGPIKGTPGMVKLAPGVDETTINNAIGSIVPLKRLGTKNEMAAVTLFLVSEAGEYVTGHTVVADGGELLYKEPRIPKEMVLQMSRGVEKKSRSLLPSSKL